MVALASISSAHASYTPHDSEPARKVRENPNSPGTYTKRDSGIKALPTDLTSIQSHIRAKIRPITRDGFHTAWTQSGRSIESRTNTVPGKYCRFRHSPG